MKTNKLHPELPNVELAARASATLVLKPEFLPHVDDVVSRTLLKFCNLVAQDHCPEKPSAWARATAKNDALRVRAKESRFAFGLCSGKPPSAAYLQEDVLLGTTDAETEVELDEKARALQRILAAVTAVVASLNTDEQKLFNLLLREERPLPYHLASELGLKPDSLLRRWKRLMLRISDGTFELLRMDPFCRDLLKGLLQDKKSCYGYLCKFLRSHVTLVLT